MAKRKKRSSLYRGFRRSKRHRSKSSSSMKPTSILLAAGVYGAFREKLSNMLTPITSKIPLGNIADEAVLFGAGYLVAKKTSGVLKEVGKAAMFIEAARLGEAVISGQIGLGSAQNVGSQQLLVTTMG